MLSLRYYVIMMYTGKNKKRSMLLSMDLKYKNILTYE